MLLPSENLITEKKIKIEVVVDEMWSFPGVQFTAQLYSCAGDIPYRKWGMTMVTVLLHIKYHYLTHSRATLTPIN